MATEGSFRVASGLRKTDTRGCGSTLAASTSEAAQSFSTQAINSMHRWYENAKVCYAYLHDVPDPWFPTSSDNERYPDFSRWREWFSRGWTLQELMIPSNVQFFNKNWKSIGDKRTFAPTLRNITGVPEHIFIHGLCGNRLCVAQIMSWAAHRTTRVEDRAYSLMGLLDVNMPMLYGEGKKAFHRLQLEIIRPKNLCMALPRADRQYSRG